MAGATPVLNPRMLGQFLSDPATATKVNMEAVYAKFGMPASMMDQALMMTISQHDAPSNDGCPYLYHVALPGTAEEFRVPFAIGQPGSCKIGDATMQFVYRVEGDELVCDDDLEGVGKIQERLHFIQEPDGFKATFLMPDGVVGSRTYHRVKKQ